MTANDAPGGIAEGQAVALQARQRRVAASLRVGNPANNARELAPGAEARLECPIELDVSQIRAYERNPRRHGNPRYAEIKESIRASGVRNPITVTRRPGDTHFIVEAGGNTRLAAVQELWAETGDSRFAKLTVLFRPWRCESNVLIAHLIENEQRADLSFWDKASGIAAVKAELVVEQERSLSLRQLEAELRQFGIAIGYATLSYYRFATARLQVLGEAVADLSGLDVAKLQPRLNLLRRYAQARAALDEDACYEQVLEPVFRRHAAQYEQSAVFRVDDLCRDCEEALARLVGEPVAQCREALALLARTPPAQAASLPRGPDNDPDIEAPRVSTVNRASPEAPPTVQSLNSSTAPMPPEPAQSPPDAGPVLAEDAADVHPIPAAGHRGLVEQVWQFARLAGVSDSLRLEETAPIGLAVADLPPVRSADGASRSLRRAWWLLALICGQVHCGKVTASAATASAGDSAMIAGVDDAVADADAERLIDLPFLLWLLDAQDAAAVSFRRVVAMLAEASGALPAGSVPARTATAPRESA